MPEDLLSYPQPQMYYKVNMTALTWGELYKACGNPLTFVLSLPFLLIIKLLRLSLTASVMPQEITCRALSAPLSPAVAQRLQQVVEGLQDLGFRPFSTFEVPEMPQRSAIFALSHDSGTAYADVTYLPARNLHYFEFVSRFGDGAALTTVNRREGVAIETPPGKFNQFVRTGDPAVLWQEHQRLAENLAKEHGGLVNTLDADSFFTDFRRALREYALFQATRGVFVPMPPPTPAVGP